MKAEVLGRGGVFVVVCFPKLKVWLWKKVASWNEVNCADLSVWPFPNSCIYYPSVKIQTFLQHQSRLNKPPEPLTSSLHLQLMTVGMTFWRQSSEAESPLWKITSQKIRMKGCGFWKQSTRCNVMGLWLIFMSCSSGFAMCRDWGRLFYDRREIKIKTFSNCPFF